MNRRVLFRAGLSSGLLLPHFAGSAYALDRRNPDWTPNEQPPISEPIEPASLLNELTETKQIETVWNLVESNRSQVSIKNKSGKKLAIQIDPGTVLTHANHAWLVGGPTRYVGQFGGQFQIQPFDGKVSAATIPVPAGRTIQLVLPVLELNEPTAEKFQTVEGLKQNSVRKWTDDPNLAASLSFLSSVGTSLSVAQALAWCLNGKLKPADLPQHKVEGQPFNSFEQQCAARFLDIQKSFTAEMSNEQIIAELEKSKLSVQITAIGKKRIAGQKILTQILPDQKFLGLPVHEISTSVNTDPAASVVKLEFHVDNEIRPGLFAVDASLATRTGIDGTFVKFARTRFPLRQETEANDLLEWLEVQMAPSIAKFTKTSRSGMTSRFRVDNQTVLNLSAIEVMTNSNSSDPAFWSIDNLGIAPRSRTMVNIPSNSAKAVRIRFSAI